MVTAHLEALKKNRNPATQRRKVGKAIEHWGPINQKKTVKTWAIRNQEENRPEGLKTWAKNRP